jgi:hypothetical protein
MRLKSPKIAHGPVASVAYGTYLFEEETLLVLLLRSVDGREPPRWLGVVVHVDGDGNGVATDMHVGEA